MPFLDKTGLAHLWDKIVARLNTKADKTEVDEIKEAKADWNQNDETALDYVKNRTHYREIDELFNKTISINYSVAEFEADFHPVVGETYQIRYRDVDYTTIATSADAGGVLLGNSSLSGYGEDTGESFFISFAEGTPAVLLDMDEAIWDAVIETELVISGYKYTKIPLAYLQNINNNIVNGKGSGSLRTINAEVENSEYTMGSCAFAEGAGTVASGNHSHAEGYCTTASGMHSHAEGEKTVASGTASHAEGNNTTTSGYSSHAEGSRTVASGDYQHAQGKYNISDTTSAHIVGNGTSSTARSNAHTLDWNGNAWFAGDVYVGSTSGTNKDAGSKKLSTEGYVNSYVNSQGFLKNVKTLTFTGAVQDSYNGTSAKTINIVGKAGTGNESEMFNNAQEASGWYSHAEGDNTIASGRVSHAEGSDTVANGEYSHAEGRSRNETITISGNANATTYTTDAIHKRLNAGRVIRCGDVYAKVLSVNATTNTILVDRTLSNVALTNCTAYIVTGIANGTASHAEGFCATASGEYSHAEGESTTASNYASHAEGQYAMASGHSSHAEGSNTIASGSNQHTQGKYNISDTTSAHIVGNGTADDARSNAHTLDWNGNAWFAGDVYVGSTSGTNKDEGSVKLATMNDIESLIASVDEIKNYLGIE